MPLPSRPVAAAVIETDWGQQVHDFTFAPAGCRVSGNAVTMLGSSADRALPIDTALNDPGGWADLAGNRLVVPTGKGGLYLVTLHVEEDNCPDTAEVRVYLTVNGVFAARATAGGEGATVIPIPITHQRLLVAGDIVAVSAKQFGTGTLASVNIVALAVTRLGDTWGA
jgi:hypothetical protein